MQLSGPAGPVRATLLNALGQVVAEQQNTGNQLTVKPPLLQCELLLDEGLIREEGDELVGGSMVAP